MRKIALIGATLFLTLPTIAADVEDLVLQKVLGSLKTANAATSRSEPGRIVLASRTAGGAELAAREFLISSYGRSIGFEVADAYVAQNQERHLVQTLVDTPTRYVDAVVDLDFGTPTATTWSKLDAAIPGAKTVVFVSRPAFDRANMIAVVRADVFSKEAHSWTKIVLLERQSNGDWDFGLSSTGAHDRVHSDQGHRHRPNDYDYYHTRND